MKHFIIKITLERKHKKLNSIYPDRTPFKQKTLYILSSVYFRNS